jgi:hypothetical protein
MGSRAADSLTIPEDIEQVEKAVCTLSPSHRWTLIAYYGKIGPLWLKAAQLKVSRRTFMRRVETAERRVAEILKSLDAAPKT